MNIAPLIARARSPLIAFGLYLATSVVLQVWNEAYRSDFGGHPDEAAHVVTGLMVRDYLAGGALQTPHPLRYAEDYYASYPKVALGHYPPGFYAVEGAWLLAWPSPAMALALAAVLTALCGTATFCYGRRFLPAGAAAAAGLLFCLLPLTQQYTAIVMSDMLLALLCLLATAAFAGFVQKPTARAALAFGFLAAFAILTKASGLLLALVPPVALCLAGRLDLIKDRRLWLAPLPVVLLAAPWMLATYHITKEGAAEMGFGEYIKAALPFYAAGMWRVFGAFLLLAAAGGALLAFCRARRGAAAEGGLLALLAGGLVFYLLVPSGFDDRYLLAVAPAILLLAMLGLMELAGFLANRWKQKAGAVWIGAAVVGGLAFAASADWFEQPDKAADGFADCLAVIEREGGAAVKVLASSDARGEGALIAAAAFASERRPRGGLTVARGSKRIADVKWLGQDFELKVDSPEILRDRLVDGFDFVLVDRGVPKKLRRPDHDLVERVVANYPEQFELLESVPGERATPGEHRIDIYRVRKP